MIRFDLLVEIDGSDGSVGIICSHVAAVVCMQRVASV